MRNSGISTDRSQPLAWGGFGGHGREPMSITQLIEAGDLSQEVASLLWLAMSYGASVLVAASPQLSGKSTMLNCMLDFIPPHVKRYYLQGRFEDFSFLPSVKPASSILIAEELSDHTPSYLWDDDARKLFQLLPKGYRYAATMHASTAEQVLGELNDNLGATIDQLGHLGIVVTLAAGRRPPEMSKPSSDGSSGRTQRPTAARDRIYRLTMATLIKRISGDNKNLAIEPLAEWSLEKDEHVIGENAFVVLAEYLKQPQKRLEKEFEEYCSELESFIARGVFQMPDVRKAILETYKTAKS